MAGIAITDGDRKKAFGLFDQGETTGRVATICFAGHWYKAKKLRDEYDAEAKKRTAAAPAEESPEAQEERNETSIPTRPQPEIVIEQEEVEGDEPESLDEEEPAVWDIEVQVPTARMDKIIAQFSPQEKADAIAMVLTARLSAEV